MKTVTVDEARENLPELLRLAAAGEEVVITDGGKWVAALTQPPDPVAAAEEEAAEAAARLDFIRQLVADWERAGHVLPADDPLRKLLAEGRAA